MLILNSVSLLLKGLCNECSIIDIYYKDSEIAMEIETKSIEQAEALRKKIDVLSRAVGNV
jgi:hypothetical protein